MAGKEQEIETVTSQLEKKLQGYKSRYEKYEEAIAELQEELRKVESRPTVESYEQSLFENDLLRNEIEELREQLSRGSSRAK